MNGYSVVRHPLSRTTCPGHGPALDGQSALAIDDAPGAAITTWNGGVYIVSDHPGTDATLALISLWI